MMLARRSLEIHTQLYGLERSNVANDMFIIAQALLYFNDVDDNEVLRLLEQAKAIFARVEGTASTNVATGEKMLGLKRATEAHDLDRSMVNLELAIPHYREASRIYREISHVDDADNAEQGVIDMEK